MKRLWGGGVIVGLTLGAGLRAQNARGPARAPAATNGTTKPNGTAARAATTRPSSSNDWPTVGNDPRGTKYSALTQITPENVTQLTTAWTYDMGVPALGYTVTPIVVNNVMYFPVQGTTIVALQADSGR